MSDVGTYAVPVVRKIGGGEYSINGAFPELGLTLLTVLLYGALGGLFVLLPFVLIEAAGYSATQAGAALLPLPLVLATLSPAMGALGGTHRPHGCR